MLLKVIPLKVMAMLKEIVADAAEIQKEEDLDRIQCSMKIMFIHPERSLPRGKEKLVNRTSLDQDICRDAKMQKL